MTKILTYNETITEMKRILNDGKCPKGRCINCVGGDGGYMDCHDSILKMKIETLESDKKKILKIIGDNSANDTAEILALWIMRSKGNG